MSHGLSAEYFRRLRRYNRRTAVSILGTILIASSGFYFIAVPLFRLFFVIAIALVGSFVGIAIEATFRCPVCGSVFTHFYGGAHHSATCMVCHTTFGERGRGSEKAGDKGLMRGRLGSGNMKTVPRGVGSEERGGGGGVGGAG